MTTKSTYISYAFDHNYNYYDERPTLETKVTNTSEIETGIFTITGGTGDIAKNSEIILRAQSIRETINDT
ncbi:MAG: hypothetical protein H0X62_12570 [Bacteroidetes bacterium]|nr:hypothetical protein [Bacteroidota bacterium]